MRIWSSNVYNWKLPVLCDVSEQILFQYMGRMENLPDILVQPGICLLVRRYMKLRYRNWSQKGSAETYLQDTEDSIYYQTWKAKEKQSEKRFRNILAVELSAAAAYLFFISYSSGWGWNYAAGYMMVATVFIEYICCREVIQRYWRNELDQIMEQTESFFQKRLEQASRCGRNFWRMFLMN